MKRPILFLCTGNYYRSRFAELYFNWLATERKLGVRADSRGLQPTDENLGPIYHVTVDALRSLGVDVNPQQRMPIALTEDDLSAAARVIAVDDEEHPPMIEQRFPAWVDRVEYWQVRDLDRASSSKALPMLTQCVEALVAEWSGGER